MIREMQYDGLDLIAEYDSTGTLTARYVHGPGADEPLVQYAGASVSTRQWLLADERGSIVAVTDWSGAAIQINSYDEYGAPAPGNAGRFGYTGQVWLPETGLYHYKNRAYNPELGRFMQTDPIGVNGGMNLYAYVGGDPVNLVDPLGLEMSCTGEGPNQRCTVTVPRPRRRPRRTIIWFDFPPIDPSDLFPFTGPGENGLPPAIARVEEREKQQEGCEAAYNVGDALEPILSELATAMQNLGYDPSNMSLIVTGTGSLHVAGGSSVSGGAWYALDGENYGLIGSLGVGGGLDISVGATLSVVSGTGQDLAANGVRLNVGLGPVDGNVAFSDSSVSFAGGGSFTPKWRALTVTATADYEVAGVTECR